MPRAAPIISRCHGGFLRVARHPRLVQRHSEDEVKIFQITHLKRASFVKKVALDPKPLRVNGGLPVLALLAFAVGGIAGLIGAVFRLVLEWSDRFRDAFITWAHSKEIGGVVLVVGGSGRGA